MCVLVVQSEARKLALGFCLDEVSERIQFNVIRRSHTVQLLAVTKLLTGSIVCRNDE